MSQKKSSFQMGNQFNGYGDTVYLKADTVKLPAISQENVQLTPDYSGYALNAIGANPIVLNSEGIDNDINLMIGSLPSINQVTLAKNSSGDFVTAYSIASNSFVDNSYSTYKKSTKTVTKSYIMYFVVTQSNLLIKRTRTSNKANEDIIANLSSGQQVKVVLENNNYVYGASIDNTNTYNWIKVLHPLEKKYQQDNETAGTEIEGWVPRIFIREDRIKPLYFNELYDYSKIQMYHKFKNTDANKKANRVGEVMETVNSFKNWGIVGGGSYHGVDRKTYDKWNVAVGPGVIDWEYPIDGGATADDMKGFSKFIKVFLSLKESVTDPNKSKKQTIECYLYDVKAHSYHVYPYPSQIVDQLKKDKCPTSQYTSDFVDHASASVVGGLVQTGIKFPYVTGENRAVVAFGHMDGTIIEFCSDTVNLGFEISDYELEYIEVNYEKKTRGEEIKK